MLPLCSCAFNSTNGSDVEQLGIDIIAGNHGDELQPMVLGDNLVHCLRHYAKGMDQIVGTITSLIENISALDVALATHIHPQAFPAGVPNIIDPKICASAIVSISKLVSLDTFSVFAEKFKLEAIEKEYLSSGADKKIRSKYNNVN